MRVVNSVPDGVSKNRNWMTFAHIAFITLLGPVPPAGAQILDAPSCVEARW